MPQLTEAELKEKLDTIVERLRKALSPIVIYLFGSYVYGSPNRHSDIDLLVIVENSDQSHYERDGQAYLALGDIRCSIDVQVHTREEFEQRSALPVSFERTVKTKGKLLYAA